MSMDTRKEVLFVLIQEYADWEFALLAPGLRRGFGVWEPRYEVRTVAADEVNWRGALPAGLYLRDDTR